MAWGSILPGTGKQKNDPGAAYEQITAGKIPATRILILGLMVSFCLVIDQRRVQAAFLNGEQQLRTVAKPCPVPFQVCSRYSGEIGFCDGSDRPGNIVGIKGDRATFLRRFTGRVLVISRLS